MTAPIRRFVRCRIMILLVFLLPNGYDASTRTTFLHIHKHSFAKTISKNIRMLTDCSTYAVSHFIK